MKQISFEVPIRFWTLSWFKILCSTETVL